MPQVSIYLQDDLAEALKRRKDAINVSQVCAAALRQELAKQDRLDKGMHDKQALIERLRLEKQDTLARSGRIGRPVRKLNQCNSCSWTHTTTYSHTPARS